MSKVKVYRTIEGTLFEVAAGLALALSLGIILHRMSPGTLCYALAAWGFMGCLSALMLWLAYHPHSAYVRMTMENDPDNELQTVLVCHLLRFLGLFVAVLQLLTTLAFAAKGQSVLDFLLVLAAPTLTVVGTRMARKIKEAADIQPPKK